jgi:hypothetical protein
VRKEGSVLLASLLLPGIEAGVIVPTLNARNAFRMGHPAKDEADPSLTTPKLKKTFGAPCAQDDRLNKVRRKDGHAA